MQKKTKEILNKIYKVIIFFAMVAAIIWINAVKLQDDTLSNYEKTTDDGVHDYYNDPITPVIAALFYRDEDMKTGFNPDMLKTEHKKNIAVEDVKMAIIPKTVNAINTPVIEKLYDEIANKERFRNVVLIYNSAKNARDHVRIIKRVFPYARITRILISKKDKKGVEQEVVDKYLQEIRTFVVFLANLDRGLNSQKSERLANEAIFFAQKNNYQMNVFDIVDEYIAAAIETGGEFAYAFDTSVNNDFLNRQKENLSKYVLKNRQELMYYYARNIELAMQDKNVEIPQKTDKNYRLFDRGTVYVKVFNKDYDLVFEELKLNQSDGIITTLAKMAGDVVNSSRGMAGRYHRIYLITEMEPIHGESGSVLANYLEPDDGIYVSYGKNAGIMLDSERPENPEILIARLRDTAKIKSSVSNSDLSFYRFKSVEMQYEN